MRIIRLGIVGCGLMGREIASAIARWCHLPDMDVRPEIISVCDTNKEMMNWFVKHFPTIKQKTASYEELLDNSAVEAVYVAVPHNLHAEFYCAAIEAGKHLLGEKPFGIDLKTNEQISDCIRQHPEVFVRCSSESIFFPAMQRIGRMLEENVFGAVIEVNSGFLHSSDLDFNKPINWKRMLEFNGEYGCMGDLGMHACHMPFRAGWVPKNVRAILSNIVRERPNGQGTMVQCETWDNATLLCEATDSSGENRFPMTIRTHRIAPGNKNTWYFEVYGTRASARWSSREVNTLYFMRFEGDEQAWQRIDMGHQVAYKSITGGIFETGFSDTILQMCAAFFYELHHGEPLRKFAGCVTPSEASLSHRLFTAALKSQETESTIQI